MTLPNQYTTVVVLPGATRAFNQQNSPHSTTDAASRPHEETRPPLYLLRHGTHSLCASPPELFLGKYQERLTEIRREDPPSTTGIIANNTSFGKTLRGIGLPTATAWLILETATIHVPWVMGQLSAPVFPAYLDESVKLCELSPTTPNKDQALPPVEGIIGHCQQIGQPFPLQEKNTDDLYLPTSARTFIADWLRSVPAKLPRKSAQKCLLL